MQIDHNALNLAVATKLSSMGQEWGWSDCINQDSSLCPYTEVGDCDSCNNYETEPLDFCGSYEAFGRLVEFCLGHYRYADICKIITKTLTDTMLGVPIKVALAQAFIGGEK